MTVAALILSLMARTCLAAPTTGAPYGILILAHGSDAQWNAQISDIGSTVNMRVPTEIALGMADPGSIQIAINRLEQRGISKIAVVPFFIDSHSELMDQTRYVLRLSPKPSQVFIGAMGRLPLVIRKMAGMDFNPHQQIVSKAKLTLTQALNDDPLVADILIARAKELSQEPSHETVILVGHGPVDEAENAAWLSTMKRLCRQIQTAGSFRAAWAATIRDDSPAPVKAKAAAALRAMVLRAGKNNGRALVIPDLIARGGIDGHITAILRGLSYGWNDKTLCPDPRLALWVLKRGRSAFSRR